MWNKISHDVSLILTLFCFDPSIKNTELTEQSKKLKDSSNRQDTLLCIFTAEVQLALKAVSGKAIKK